MLELPEGLATAPANEAHGEDDVSRESGRVIADLVRVLGIVAVDDGAGAPTPGDNVVGLIRRLVIHIEVQRIVGLEVVAVDLRLRALRQQDDIVGRVTVV